MRQLVPERICYSLGLEHPACDVATLADGDAPAVMVHIPHTPTMRHRLNDLNRVVLVAHSYLTW